MGSTRSPQSARLLAALALAIALLFSLTLATTSASAAHKSSHAHKSGKHKKKKKARKASAAPLTGIYDACSYSDPKNSVPVPDCTDRLAVLRQGGFQVVLNYWTGGMSIQDNVRYANA